MFLALSASSLEYSSDHEIYTVYCVYVSMIDSVLSIIVYVLETAPWAGGIPVAFCASTCEKNQLSVHEREH